MALQIDAGLIGRRHSAGCGVASRLDHRAPAPLRNHSRDNVMAMREKMRQQRGKNIVDSLKLPQPEFKLKQFGNVKSRLFDLPRPAPNDRIEPGRRSGRRSPSAPPAPCASPEPQMDEEENIFPASSRPDGAGEGAGEEMDLATFEAEVERLKAMHGKKPPAAPQQAAPQGYRKDSAGRPAYLQKIKMDLAEQQRLAEERRNGPAIPEGYRQMPENDRQDTLESLRKKREELEKAFQRLPFNIETAAQKQREKTIMDKIKETDAAIKTFSNPMVLIGA